MCKKYLPMKVLYEVFHQMVAHVRFRKKRRNTLPNTHMVLVVFNKGGSLLSNLIKDVMSLSSQSADAQGDRLAIMAARLAAAYKALMETYGLWADRSLLKCPQCEKSFSPQDLTGLSTHQLRVISL